MDAADDGSIFDPVVCRFGTTSGSSNASRYVDKTARGIEAACRVKTLPVT